MVGRPNSRTIPATMTRPRSSAIARTVTTGSSAVISSPPTCPRNVAFAAGFWRSLRCALVRLRAWCGRPRFPGVVRVPFGRGAAQASRRRRSRARSSALSHLVPTSEDRRAASNGRDLWRGGDCARLLWVAGSMPGDAGGSTRGQPTEILVLEAFYFHTIRIAPAGASVATETCGQMRPLKLSKTVCEYWIWVA